MQQDSLGSTEVARQVVNDFIREKRADRRWRNIRFLVGAAIILFVVGGAFLGASAPLYGDSSKGYVSLVRLNGLIAPGQEFSARTVIPALESAFQDKKSKGVVLDINSGGGTPVQAAIIHDAILEMKNRFHKKVITVGEDMMASGAYFVAVASDKIYVNPSSLTGSVGVIMKDFGFPELIQKIGIERRVYASGVNKDRLDPFRPQSPEDVLKIKHVIGEIHDNFRSAVELGRKGLLKGDMAELFSGDFWSGQTAVKLGLVDQLGNLSDVLKNEFHVQAYRDYSAEPSLMKNIIGQFSSAIDALPVSSSSVRILEQLR